MSDTPSSALSADYTQQQYGIAGELLIVINISMASIQNGLFTLLSA